MLMCVRAHVCVLGLRGRMAFLVVVHAAFLNALVCVCVCVCVYACVYVCVCMRVLGLRGRVAFLVVVHAASPYVLVCVCVCVCVCGVCVHARAGSLAARPFLVVVLELLVAVACLREHGLHCPMARGVF